jgi:hypothetical protein
MAFFIDSIRRKCLNYWGLVLSAQNRVLAEPNCIALFIPSAGGKCEDGLSGIFLAGLEIKTVQFEKENSNQEPRALVTVQKGRIADDTTCIDGRQFHNARRGSVRMVRKRSGQCGLQQALISYSTRAAVERKQPPMNGQNIAQFNPCGLVALHLAKVRRVFR